MIKISFSGIIGSGKTSLLNEAKKILSLKYKVEALEEISPKNPFDDEKKSCFISQFFYLTTQINEENIKSMKTPDILICDRSVFDQWIDWKRYLSEIEMNGQLEEKNNLLKNIYEFWKKTYNLIFFIRTDPQEWEKRQSQENFLKLNNHSSKPTDEIYLKTIKEDNLEIFTIWNNNSIDESTLKIIEIVSQYNQK